MTSAFANIAPRGADTPGKSWRAFTLARGHLIEASKYSDALWRAVAAIRDWRRFTAAVHPMPGDPLGRGRLGQGLYLPSAVACRLFCHIRLGHFDGVTLGHGLMPDWPLAQHSAGTAAVSSGATGEALSGSPGTVMVDEHGFDPGILTDSDTQLALDGDDGANMQRGAPSPVFHKSGGAL